jgi:hypothetical protein
VPWRLWIGLHFDLWSQGGWLVVALAALLWGGVLAPLRWSLDEDYMMALFFTCASMAGGVALLVARAVIAHRRLHLLRRGEPVAGRLVSRSAIPQVEGDVPSYRLVFEYTVGGRVHRIAHVTDAQERFEDGAEQPMLFDPARPHLATPIEDLPGMARFDADGAFVVERGLPFGLILPALACAALCLALVRQL